MLVRNRKKTTHVAGRWHRACLAAPHRPRSFAPCLRGAAAPTIAITLALGIAACARDDKPATPEATATKSAQEKHVAAIEVRPQRLDATDERIASLKVPPSFAV